MSGHQQVLLRGLVEAGAATDLVVYDALSTAVEASVNRKLFGVDQPVTLIEKAGLVLSFGDDFLGAGVSPVAAARQYARFRRTTPRGVLVQIEPKMTLTGANADRWVVIAPGTEGVFALGLVRELLQRKEYAGNLSPALVAAVEPYNQRRGQPDHRSCGRSHTAPRRHAVGACAEPGARRALPARARAWVTQCGGHRAAQRRPAEPGEDGAARCGAAVPAARAHGRQISNRWRI